MDLREIRELQATFDAKHGLGQPWDTPVTQATLNTLEHLLVCLLGELGEFANEVKKIVRGDTEYSESLSALKDELADVFVYVVKLANQMDIDLEHEYLRKLEINEKRFRAFERKPNANI